MYDCTSGTMTKEGEGISVFDISKSRRLAKLDIRNTNVIINICADYLTVCILEEYDLSQGNILNTLVQTKTLTHLQLCSCKSELFFKDSQERNVDFSECTSLDYLEIRKPHIRMSISAHHLTVCILQDYDISNDMFSTLQKTKSLTRLNWYDCRLRFFKCPCPVLDVSNCTNFDNLEIRNTNVVINICTDHLTVCILYRYVLTKGNILAALSQSET